jgi:hypothetical protein
VQGRDEVLLDSLGPVIFAEELVHVVALLLVKEVVERFGHDEVTDQLLLDSIP